MTLGKMERFPVPKSPKEIGWVEDMGREEAEQILIVRYSPTLKPDFTLLGQTGRNIFNSLESRLEILCPIVHPSKPGNSSYRIYYAGSPVYHGSSSCPTRQRIYD